MGCEMMLTVSQQKYLQVIDILEQEQGVVRQIDVAVYLGYSRASVCRAVKSLKAKGLIVQRAHEIELSAYGKALGRQLNEVRTRMQEACMRLDFRKGLIRCQLCSFPSASRRNCQRLLVNCLLLLV